MTEDEAKGWLADRYTGAQIAALTAYVELLRSEAEQQSLIARSTFDQIWARHIVDSAQLNPWCRAGQVADIGSGAGLPGIVLAILGRKVTLIEPRRKRVDFLKAAAKALRLNVEIEQTRSRKLAGVYQTVTARAVGSMMGIFSDALHLANAETIWVLPRGSTGEAELEEVAIDWTGVFHVERSVTDAQSSIIIARGVKRRRA